MSVKGNYQAITTKHYGPTNHRGSRVKATCEAGSVTLPWDYALNTEKNHDKAALALAEKLGWVGGWSAGYLGHLKNPYAYRVYVRS